MFQLTGLDDRLKQTEDTSRELLQKAIQALSKAQNNLKPQLATAISQVDQVEQGLGSAKKILDDIDA